MKKRMFSLIIVLSMLIVGIPMIAHAETSGKCGDNLTWTLDDNGTITISGTGDMINYEYYNLSPFYNDNSINSVIIEDGVSSIGACAFVGCSNLSSIKIPKTLTFVGGNAFNDCANLKKLYITDMAEYLNIDFGNSVTHILSGSNNKLYLNDKRVTSIEIPNTVTRIPKFAFCGVDSITDVIIPDSVTSIGDSAFRNCSSLRYVDIPDSVNVIGHYAFFDCESLEEIELPKNITYIGNSLFYDCRNLSKIVLPESIVNIYNYAFSGCWKLTNIKIPNNVTHIGVQAFWDCSNLTSVVLGENIKTIGKEAFYFCGNLTDVYITNIDNWCNIDFDGYSSSPLYYAKNLYINNELTSSIEISDNITALKKYAFNNYCSLNSIAISQSVRNIGEKAFYNCDGLTSIYIPDSVLEIETSAFGYCKNIVDVYYGGSEEEWKEMYIGSDNEYLKNATLHFNSIALPTAEFSVITEEDKVYVKNISEISGSIAVITTKYNDGILLDIQVERMIMLPSEEKYLFIPKNGRIFIWNSLKGMKPLSNEL